MCPKSSKSADVSNPAGYSLAQQGEQFDWTMTQPDGTTKKVQPTRGNKSDQTTQEPIKSSTGINTSSTSGGLTRM